MKPSKKGRGSSHKWFSGGIGALLTALVGLVLFFHDVGGGVTRSSYDIPFLFRGGSPEEVVLVYLDEKSHADLNQPLAAAWDRDLHAQLIERLTEAGAKVIAFDILFTEASANPAADAHLTRAIKESKRVVLCGSIDRHQGVAGQKLEVPYEPFKAGAAAWGNANLFPDPDYGVRACFPNIDNGSGQPPIPWLPWAVAHVAGADLSKADPQATRWLNYYGPPGTLPYVSYSQALQADGAAPGFFKNKIVFVGAWMAADFSGMGKDDYRTPYSFWNKGFAPGVDIHATATLNLLHHDWLTRLPAAVEVALIILVAALAGFGLMRFQPLSATVIAFVGAALITVAALLLVWNRFVWFAWIIQILEVGVALFCSVVFNSIRLYVEKRLLEQSLAAHLSPKLVKKLLADPALRELGGSQQEVSILFSDIANFSRISETMSSDDLVRMMNKYFETALQCIHETDGTVVKLIGDAIFAIWNAPVEQHDHRERACRAALRLREKIVEFNAEHLSLPLRTRVGLHAGDACVGNIGSAQRFDYTALGDSINLTSRLEGLNKFLGTSVLATREVERAVEDSLVWRPVGHFQLKGLGRAVEVHELIGGMDRAEPTRAWREEFARALQDFRQRRFDTATQKFQKTIELRRVVEPEITTGTTLMTSDGPSRFYLDKIEQFLVHAPPREWIGEVELTEK